MRLLMRSFDAPNGRRGPIGQASLVRLMPSLALAIVVGGCNRPTPVPPAPSPEPAPVVVSPWPGVLASARRAVDARRYTEADRILGEFAVQHAQTAEGAEADFWRALFRADPANTESTVREQLAAFDSYLTGGPSLPRYTEAQVLRRMVEAMDSTRALIVAVRAAADARERAKNDEVKRLSDELEKTVTEMERIRRRLAPKPEEKKPPM
jgi:hypothetical protein